MADEPRIQTQARLPHDVHAWLLDRAKTRDISINETLVRALRFAMTATAPDRTITTTIVEKVTL